MPEAKEGGTSLNFRIIKNYKFYYTANKNMHKWKRLAFFATQITSLSLFDSAAFLKNISIILNCATIFR
jgi:hypothetical protein